MNEKVNKFLLTRDKFMPEIHLRQHVGNKAKGRISKRVFQENKARQIFRKTNISYPLIRTRTCVTDILIPINLFAIYQYTKNKERIQIFKETGGSRYIYQDELDKVCFQPCK